MQVQPVNLSKIQSICVKEHKEVRNFHDAVIAPALAKIQKGFFLGKTQITLKKLEKRNVLKLAENIEERQVRADSHFRKIQKLIRKLKRVDSNREPYRYNRIQRRLLVQQERFEHELAKIYELSATITTKIIAAENIKDADKQPLEVAQKKCKKFIESIGEKATKNREKLEAVKKRLSANLKEKIGLDLFSDAEFSTTLRLDAEYKSKLPHLHKTIQKLKRYSALAKIEEQIAAIDEQLKKIKPKSEKAKRLNLQKKSLEVRKEEVKATYIKELFYALNETKNLVLNQQETEKQKELIEKIDQELNLLSEKYKAQLDSYEETGGSYELKRSKLIGQVQDLELLSSIERPENFFIAEKNLMSSSLKRSQSNLMRATRNRRAAKSRPGLRIVRRSIDKSPDEKKYLYEVYEERVKILSKILRDKRNFVLKSVDQGVSPDNTSLKVVRTEIQRLQGQCEMLFIEMRQIGSLMFQVGIAMHAEEPEWLKNLSGNYHKEKNDYLSKITKPYVPEIRSLETLGKKVKEWLEQNKAELPRELAKSLNKSADDALSHRMYSAREGNWSALKSSARSQTNEGNKVRVEAKYMLQEVILEVDKIKDCRRLLDELSSAVAKTGSKGGETLLQEIKAQHDRYLAQAHERKEVYTTFVDSLEKTFPKIFSLNQTLMEIGPNQILIGSGWGSDQHTRRQAAKSEGTKAVQALKKYELMCISNAIEKKYSAIITCLSKGQPTDSIAVELLKTEIVKLQELFTSISSGLETSKKGASKHLTDAKNLVVDFQKNRIYSLENGVTQGQLIKFAEEVIQSNPGRRASFPEPDIRDGICPQKIRDKD